MRDRIGVRFSHHVRLAFMLNRRQLVMLLSAVVAACALWLYVYRILIPHQKAAALLAEEPRGNLSDLYPRWLGARELLLDGRDPYSAEVTREIQTGYYGRPLDPARPNDPKDQQAFAYPVYVVFFLAPTIKLPFPGVQRVFVPLLVFLTGMSVLWWLRELNWRPSVAGVVTWIVAVLGCFPAIQGFKLQQLTLLVAALLACAMSLVTRRWFVLAGILLALATIKPQLAVLAILWLGIWVAGNWRERQKLLWSFAMSMAVLLIGGEWLLPGWIREFRAASAAYYRYTGGGRSVLDVLLTQVFGRTVAGIAVVACMIFVWKIRHSAEDSADFRWSLSLVMATTLVVIPMFAPYNQLLLIPALMVIVRALRSLWGENHLTRFVVAVTALAVLWPWLAAAALGIALLFLPAPTVWKAWDVPLYTSLAIPITVLATLIIGRSILHEQRGNRPGVDSSHVLRPSAASE